MGELCPPIDFLTIQKKIISGCYFKKIDLLNDDLHAYFYHLKQQLVGEKAVE